MNSASRVKNCVRCGAEIKGGFFPFCSSRCKDLDFFNWISESYVIAGEEISEPDNKNQDD